MPSVLNRKPAPPAGGRNLGVKPGNHEMTYTLVLGAWQQQEYIAVSVYIDPMIINEDDWVALYANLADLQADQQRVANGESPDNYDTWEWVRDFGNIGFTVATWFTDVDVSDIQYAALYTKDYYTGKYIYLGSAGPLST